MRFDADVSACSGNEWVGPRKMGYGAKQVRMIGQRYAAAYRLCMIISF